MSLYRPPVPRAYGIVTVLAVLVGLGLVALSAALLVRLAGHEPQATWIDFTEVFQVIAWQQLVGGIAVVPPAVAARCGSNIGRVASVLAASLLALTSLRVAALLPPLGLLGLWWVAVALVLLGASGREYCLAAGRARADEREWARRQPR